MEQSELPEDIRELIKEAEDGDAAAQFELGQIFRMGIGVEQNNREAVCWYRKAAEQKNARGQNAMGVVYLNGLTVSPSDEEAITWFRKAAKKGYAAAQFNLGWMYDQGRGVKENPRNAAIWYRKAALQGYAPGQFNLGVMLIEGIGVKKNYIKALDLFRQAAKQTDYDVCFDAIEFQDLAERFILSEKITLMRENILEHLKANVETSTMTHYTSLVAGNAILLEKSPLRLGHINALNDPNEGKLLWRYLGYAPVEGNPIFVGCFLPDDDSLNMWRFYSKNNDRNDACGCAITFNISSFFDYNLLQEPSANIQKNDSNIAFSNTGKYPNESAAFYRIIYISGEMDIHDDDEHGSIKAAFMELKKEVGYFLGAEPSIQKLQQLARLLGPLPYLLKDADYEAEKEHRIVITHLEYGAKEIQFLEPDLTRETRPSLYLELHRTDHLAPVKHVTLGPKAPHQEMMIPYWHHKLKSDFADQLKTKPEFYIRASKCAYQ